MGCLVVEGEGAVAEGPGTVDESREAGEQAAHHRHKLADTHNDSLLQGVTQRF